VASTEGYAGAISSLSRAVRLNDLRIAGEGSGELWEEKRGVALHRALKRSVAFCVEEETYDVLLGGDIYVGGRKKSRVSSMKEKKLSFIRHEKKRICRRVSKSNFSQYRWASGFRKRKRQGLQRKGNETRI